MFEYFLFTDNSAVATCFEPPYSKSPATMILSPALTILPEIPSISLIDFGLFSENTKLVWHSGIFSKIFLIFVN
jgi:hypothetical protein